MKLISVNTEQDVINHNNDKFYIPGRRQYQAKFTAPINYEYPAHMRDYTYELDGLEITLNKPTLLNVCSDSIKRISKAIYTVDYIIQDEIVLDPDTLSGRIEIMMRKLKNEKSKL